MKDGEGENPDSTQYILREKDPRDQKSQKENDTFA